MLSKSILMAKPKQNLNLKIQMLAGKGTKAFFEKLYTNITSLVPDRVLPQSIVLLFPYSHWWIGIYWKVYKPSIGKKHALKRYDQLVLDRVLPRSNILLFPYRAMYMIKIQLKNGLVLIWILLWNNCVNVVIVEIGK